MTVELKKKNDIKTLISSVTQEIDRVGELISLVSQEIDRVGEAREKYGFYDPSYFYHLVDIRNKLLVMSVDEELSRGFNDEKVGGLSDAN